MENPAEKYEDSRRLERQAGEVDDESTKGMEIRNYKKTIVERQKK